MLKDTENIEQEAREAALLRRAQLKRVQMAGTGLFTARFQVRKLTLEALLAGFEQAMEAVPSFAGVQLVAEADGSPHPCLRAKVTIGGQVHDASRVYNDRSVFIGVEDMDEVTLACVLLVEGGWSSISDYEARDLGLLRIETTTDNIAMLRALATNSY